MDPADLGGAKDGGLGCRPTIAHDLGAPARMWRKHPGVEEQVDLGVGCQRGQPREELQGLEHQVGRPIAPSRIRGGAGPFARARPI